MIYKVFGEGQTVFFETNVDKDKMEELVKWHDSAFTKVMPLSFVRNLPQRGVKVKELQEADESNLSGVIEVDAKRWAENHCRIRVVK